jgi:integrase/recombinase XerD
MLVSDAVRDYLSYIINERGLSIHTRRCYQTQLGHFQRWAADNGYPDPTAECLTTAVLRRFQYSLSARGLRPRSIHGYFDALDSLCTFLVANGAIPDNPTKALTLPKKDAAIRNVVTEPELMALVEAVERIRKERTRIMARAVLYTFLYSGLRRAECCDLKVDDINLKERSILVRCGKGSKSRKVFACDECIGALREWLAVRTTGPGFAGEGRECNHDWLWAYNWERRLCGESLVNLIEEIKTIAGFADRKHIKPHSLRHACATRLLRNGANIRDIQAFLGHGQLQTTAIYLHSNEEQLRNIADLTALQPKSQGRDNVIRLPHQEQDRNRLRRIAR